MVDRAGRPPLSSEQESARLAALARYAVLDSPREAVFDRITEMASIIYAAPKAAISLVDADRIWFKSRVGLDLTEVPRGGTFCGRTVDLAAPHVVNDAAAALAR